MKITLPALTGREWHGTVIRQRMDDGYVNATAMCQANGKHLAHYFATDRAKAYFSALSSVTGIPEMGANGLVQIRKGGRTETMGTWVHPRIGLDLARWISPRFAVWCDGFLLDWFQGNAAHQQQAPQPPVPQPQAPPLPPLHDLPIGHRQLPITERAAHILLFSVSTFERGIDNGTDHLDAPGRTEDAEKICSLAVALYDHYVEAVPVSRRTLYGSLPIEHPMSLPTRRFRSYVK